MVLILLNKCVTILFLLKYCRSSENLGKRENITKLYELIADAIKEDFNKPHISRRVINVSGYQIHINKLKDVNGFKMHNIVINHTDTNSTIYIDNPLESKLAHPFMTLEAFKDAIVQQRISDRKEFLRSKKIAEDRKKWADIKSKRTLSKRKYTKALSSKTTAKTTQVRRLVLVLNTKSSTVKRKDYNASTTTKTKPNTKEHMNMTANETRVDKNLSSPTSLRKENIMKLPSTVYSRVKLLYVDENYPRLPKVVTLEERSKTNNYSDATTIPEEKIEDKDRKEPMSVEEELPQTVDDNNSTEMQATIFKESTVSDEDGSNTPNNESIINDNESTDENLTTVDEKGETNVDETKAVNGDETEATNGDEGEITTVSEVETSTESSMATTTTTLPPTTRERWSRPRVYMGDSEGGASTSSLIT